MHLNSTFIVLVPKKDRSFKLKDFRPISLLTSIYKIVAKVLSVSLGEVLGDTIFENQSAFIAERQILYASLIANELVEDTIRRKQKGVSF